ncbi:uncharacterized protein LOC123306836 [Coccinella septempunctata]|uniref:uncharacterized protein LOC123306836 n=1 Tax=Coccinella septempunctata TaxID=41139 RepID=UPI001D082B10|nr:uncharacterized protein LOC123306836 [Coccinella septempunctata]
MVRKRKVNSNTSSGGNERIETFNDPKFRYKCYVNLENCDFSNYSVGSTNKKDSAKQTDGKGTISSKKSKMLTVFSNQQCIPESEETYSVGPEEVETNPRIVQFKQQLPNSYRQINQPKTGGSVMSAPDLPERKFLRARKKVNYKEKKSIGTPEVSTIASPGSRKMPIYKKVKIDSPKSKKRKGDLYDFVQESDEEKDSDVSFKINLPTKKRRVNHQMKFHEKDIYRRVNNAKVNREIETIKYKDKIHRIMNKFATKIRSNKENNETVEKHVISKKKIAQGVQIEKNLEPIIDTVFNSTMLPERDKMIFLDESIIPSGSKEHTLKPNVMGSVKVNNTRKICIPASENSSLNTGQDSCSNSLSLNSLSDMSIRSFDGNVDNLFGFADDVGAAEEVPANHINILQNVIINRPTPSMPYISTPKRFKEQKSWRFDSDVVNRNPHFIALKKNSLPSLNQEPVLDHTFDERIKGVNKMVSVPTKKSSPKQQSILSFVERTNENHNYSQSLYDIDELSPTKDKNGDKENSLEKKLNSNEKKHTRRNILGVINDINTTNSPTSKNNGVSIELKTSTSCSDDSSKEQDNFGFDSISGVSKKNTALDKSAKPFRIEMTYKKYNRVDKIPDKMKQPVRDSELRRLIEDDPGFDKVVDKDGLDCGELGLFEDFNQTTEPFKNYKTHSKKRTDRETDKNKISEAKLSKGAQKWIKEFNKMCDEVEQEQLNIE